MTRWQLPDGIDEWLPDEARRLELLRTRFLALGAACGFEPVVPPLIEYLDSLLTGSGETLDLQTFKLVDQQDGRALGVRADMTPQVARIDAHALKREGPSRLLYTGTVLRARTDAVGGSRNPQQFGAELFGHAGPESDVEIIRLMLDTALSTGVPDGTLVLSLGHVGVYAALLEAAALPDALGERLYEAMARGSVPDLQALADDVASRADGTVGDGRAHDAQLEALRALVRLPELRGDATVLARAGEALAGAGAAAALDALQAIIDAVAHSHPAVRLHVDLGDLRGYRYHTGVLFAVHDERGRELARGGRYDAIGEAFGSRRPATGFSGELAALAALMPTDVSSGGGDGAILLREPGRDGAWQAARALRERGETVIGLLPGAAPDPRVTRELVPVGGSWSVRPLVSG